MLVVVGVGVSTPSCKICSAGNFGLHGLSLSLSSKEEWKKSIFSVYKLGFGLITASGLQIKEFPLYGMDKYYKMVGKKIIAEGFLPGREISVSENSAAGDIHCMLIKCKCVYVYSLISHRVQQTSQFTPLVLELSLVRSHLLWGEFSAFSAAIAIHNSPLFVPPGTHHCWVDRGGMIWKACPTPLHMADSVTRAPAVTHPSTNRARRCLTSVIWRELVTTRPCATTTTLLAHIVKNHWKHGVISDLYWLVPSGLLKINVNATVLIVAFVHLLL